MAHYQEILAFWFGAGTSEFLRPRRVWFAPDPTFDAEIRERFQSDWERASRGELADWADARESCLALIILCDQVPRNLHGRDDFGAGWITARSKDLVVSLREQPGRRVPNAWRCSRD